MWSLFEQRMQTRMENEHIVGAAVAVMQKGIVIYQQGFGVGDLQTQTPVNSNTVFGTASISKSFTALATLKLADQGFLSIDDSITKYIPGFHIKGMENTDGIKVHHLLTHTTGLAPVKRNEERNHFKDEKHFLMEHQHPLLGKPGEYFSYSNDMFSLLGEIIEKVSGKLYRRYIIEEILSPLEMNRSTLSVEELQKLNQVSTPYTYNKEKNQHEEQDWPTLGVYEVGGGVRSTALDLLEYGDLYLNKGKIGESSIISPQQIRKMSKPYAKVGRNRYYGYGLKVTPDYHGRTLIEHGGSQPGVSSNFGFIPEEELVVVVLSNVSNVAAGDIWLEAVNTAIGLPLEERDEKEPEITLSIKQLERLVGTYSSEEGMRLEITLDHDVPIVHIDNEVYDAYASDEQTLVVKATERPIRFYFKNKQPWAAFFGMRMLLKDD
ncbi:serine hydrolase domain-containing protein [Salinibacillus xinjiangensis]|uniref:Serine hydrolase n=1 Tax=Salinibacillus xinjiangensis TaxID=1229268 RepID=A0A6G1X8F2_9BACI|nr:serine hydrolase domain-containing protein [Salinibacillus xinjiangensis]MRG87283.1 serine hydrolase [Salinibacillus xinjiangensis]